MSEVRAEVTVPGDPARVFALFTEEVDRWWRRGERYGGPDVRGHRFEPFVGGRFLEVLDAGESVLGRITAWDPPTRLAFTWRQGNWDPEEITRVEVTFTARASDTYVVLRHYGFEAVTSSVGCEVGYHAGWRELLGWLADAGHAQIDQPKGAGPCSSISRS